MARTDDIKSMQVSEATRKLNPGLFAQPIVNIKPRKLGQRYADECAREVLEKLRPQVDDKKDAIELALRAMQPTGPRYRSKWEAEFHGILKARCPHDYVEHEPMRLRLAHNAWYKPDFAVIEANSIEEDNSDAYKITFWEVKGHWREAARVRIKVAARLFPWARFVAVVKQKKKDGGGWKEEVFQP